MYRMCKYLIIVEFKLGDYLGIPPKIASKYLIIVEFKLFIHITPTLYFTVNI